MGRVKKVVVILVLLAIIVGVIAWNVRARYAVPPARKQYLEGLVEKVDEKTLEVVALPRQEWENAGTKDGYWKNPNTGQYTMCTAIKCHACGETIPQPVFPLLTDGPPPDLQNYKCPRCGGQAIAPVKPWQGPR